MTAPSNANTSGLIAEIDAEMEGRQRGYADVRGELLFRCRDALVTAASAQAEITSLAEAVRRAEINEAIWSDLADEHKARADRLAEIASKLSAAISWLDYPFIDNRTPEAELRQRVGFMMKDAEPHRAALQQETQP